MGSLTLGLTLYSILMGCFEGKNGALEQFHFQVSVGRVATNTLTGLSWMTQYIRLILSSMMLD
jgi:hypothetical protein